MDISAVLAVATEVGILRVSLEDRASKKWLQQEEAAFPTVRKI